MDSKNSKKGFIVFIVLVCLAVITAIVSTALVLTSENETPTVPRNERHERPNTSNGNIFARSKKKRSGYIATIYIKGIIQEENNTYNQEWLLDTIDDLTDDIYNKGIILFVDTPGGTVYESDEAYLALMNYKKETERPIYAYMAHMATSGGYYISCAADKIFANRNTTTGSIGVINGTSFDATELFSKLGIKPSTFTAGRNKNMRNIDSPITDEQKKIIQSELNEAYDQFTEIVAESRKMKIAKVRELADGRIYTAKQAKANGLIDEIGTLEDTIDAMNEKLEAGYKIYDYEYYYERNMFDYFPGFSASKKRPATSAERVAEKVENAINTISPSIKYPAYIYLP